MQNQYIMLKLHLHLHASDQKNIYIYITIYSRKKKGGKMLSNKSNERHSSPFWKKLICLICLIRLLARYSLWCVCLSLSPPMQLRYLLFFQTEAGGRWGGAAERPTYLFRTISISSLSLTQSFKNKLHQLHNAFQFSKHYHLHYLSCSS